ncbi:NAD(P)H-hydrate dehydratase [Streptomyces sp. CAU 1734]|uniref:NAD(P)H-hydrate dehydratase n=1 Tax=Streptomyces sp. CAU 1734 TaxID=3140360 RepID=UPI003260954C
MKGDGGQVIVVGGSSAYSAPPFLAGLGALRAGAHGVRVLAPAGPAAGAAALEMHLLTVPGPELGGGDVRLLAEVTERLLAGRARSGARGRLVWLIGPGLGGSPQPGPVLDALAAARAAAGPVGVVVDGHLGGGPDGIARITGLAPDVVLLNRTEAAGLTQNAAGREGRVPVAALAGLARRTGAVMTAKGPHDLVIGPDRVLLRVRAGHPSMAKSSSGDVVAGVTAGLLAQNLPPAEAAALACHLVGTAGARLAARAGPGWLPGELITALTGPVRDLHTSHALTRLLTFPMSLSFFERWDRDR